MTTFSSKKNNASSTLLSTHTSGDGAIVIQSGEQSKFPASFPFRITVYRSDLNPSTGTIFVVNSASANTFTVTVDPNQSPTSVDQTFTTGAGHTFNVVNDWTYADAKEYETSIDTINTNVGNGWTPLGATLTYASSTTVTSSIDLSSFLSVGDKVMLTQTTIKYFYIQGISGTTITLNGGTDYTVANAGITLPSYSKSQTPSGFPFIFNATNITFGYTSLILTPSSQETQFSVQGGNVIFYCYAFGTTSGSDGELIGCSLPFPVNVSGQVSGGIEAGTDSGTFVTGNWLITSSIGNHVEFRLYNSSNWGTGGNKQIAATIIYPI